MIKILDGDCPDPAVFREGDTFYLTYSSGPYYPGLPICSSTDLVNWKMETYAVKDFEGKEIWAPDFFKYKDNKYYIYFSGAGTNWVIWSEHIQGPWSEPIDLKVGYIDPGHVTDEEGKRYLLLSGGHIVPLAADGLSVCGPVKKLLDPPALPEELDFEGEFPEAPNVIRIGRYYYLSYADGGTSGPATSHMIMLARANDLWGPWEFAPSNPLICTRDRLEKWICKGHGHFVEDGNGGLWVIYHAYENGYMNRGRKLLLSPVEITEDGWFQVADGSERELRMPVPCAENAERGAGTAVCSPLAWQRLRGKRWTDFAMEEGCMIWRERAAERDLRGGQIPTDARISCQCGPALLNTGDHSYELEARIHVEGGMETGLLAIYNEEIYNAASVDGKELKVYRLGRLLYRREFPEEMCWLRLRVRRHYLDFSFSRDGLAWEKVKVTIDLEPQNTNAYDGFLSVRAGVFARGSGQAVVSEIEYRTI